MVKKMILVTGTGRSGTSETAEILENLGVNMGHRFHLQDEFNPRGYFEDRDFQELNMIFTMMGLDHLDNKVLLKQWREHFNKLIATREEPWGLKDPGIADFPKLLNEYLRLKPKIVLCSRNKEDTVGSFKRFKKLSQEQAEEIFNRRIDNLKEALRDLEYLEVDCYDTDKREKLSTFTNLK